MLPDAVIDILCTRIADMEGYRHPGSRPARNHNPGDLRAGGIVWEGQTGVDDGGFCIFCDDAHGLRALRLDVANHARKWPNQTLLQFIAGDGKEWGGYAPAQDHNNAAEYAQFLADGLGCSVGITFAELASSMQSAPA